MKLLRTAVLAGWVLAVAAGALAGGHGAARTEVADGSTGVSLYDTGWG